MNGKVLVLGVALAVWATGANALSKPDWKAFADCAGAYRANSKIPDPSRSASMRASIADQANDYEAAAEHRLARANKTSVSKAQTTVTAYVRDRTRAFAGKPRSDIERFIDACPQIDD